MLFTYDVIKIDWVSFMGIQPSYKQMRDPLPVPAQSIPIEGRPPSRMRVRRKTWSRLTRPRSRAVLIV